LSIEGISRQSKVLVVNRRFKLSIEGLMKMVIALKKKPTISTEKRRVFVCDNEGKMRKWITLFQKFNENISSINYVNCTTKTFD
jgi:hypothetical protein